jgi:hypothetical protein
MSHESKNPAGAPEPEGAAPASPPQPPQLLYAADEDKRRALAVEAARARYFCPSCHDKTAWVDASLRYSVPITIVYDPQRQDSIYTTKDGPQPTSTPRLVPGIGGGSARPEDCTLDLRCGCGVVLSVGLPDGVAPREVLKRGAALGS